MLNIGLLNEAVIQSFHNVPHIPLCPLSLSTETYSSLMILSVPVLISRLTPQGGLPWQPQRIPPAFHVPVWAACPFIRLLTSSLSHFQLPQFHGCCGRPPSTAPGGVRTMAGLELSFRSPSKLPSSVFLFPVSSQPLTQGQNK